MQEVTHNNLPEAVAQLYSKVLAIEQLLLNNNEVVPSASDRLLTVKEAAQFLHLSVATIYTKVSRGEIPFMKKTKRLYFSQESLQLYIKSGRVKTNAEVIEEAEQIQLTQKRKRIKQT